MKIYGVSLGELEKLAKELDIRLYNVRTSTKYVQCTFRPLTDRWRVYKNSRKSWAVCFHGHWEMMHGIFQLNPQAKIISAMERYENKTDFEKLAFKVSQRNIGSQVEPLEYHNACKCEVK